ncbi:MAG: four helix bundle protein [Bacteroidota bacterium]
MSIASKEARETRYWIRLLKFSQITKYGTDTILSEVEEIIKILTRIVKTTQENLKNERK